jgi:radical SAM protein with 4Fe4S-binding SPASM domain
VNIFEEWVRHDVGRVYVQLFDVTLEAYFGRHLLCIHAPTCGYGPALKHNGDLYPCDHFVEPRYRLGNIHETHLLKLVSSPEQRKFGDDKRGSLTPQCQRCEVRPLCKQLSEGQVRILSRRRPWTKLPLCRPGTVLHAHAPGDADGGTTLSARPSTLRRDGVDRSGRQEAQAESAMSVREWPEVSLLSRQQRTAISFPQAKSCTNKPQDGSAMSVPAKSPLQTGSGLAQGATM